jgi:hypothetical protein
MRVTGSMTMLPLLGGGVGVGVGSGDGPGFTGLGMDLYPFWKA